MAKNNKKVVGVIAETEQKLQQIQDEITKTVTKYNDIWENRNNCLANGEPVQAGELEKQYYHFRDVVLSKLDHERIQQVNKLNDLRNEVNRIKEKIANNTNVLGQQKDSLEQLKLEHTQQITNKERGITNTVAILEDLNAQLLQLEGEV